MTQRITMEDLEAQLKLYAANLDLLGMDNRHVALIPGSKINGISFELVYVHPDHGGHTTAPGAGYNGHLGMTKREAHDTICTINATLSEVAFHLSN